MEIDVNFITFYTFCFCLLLNCLLLHLHHKTLDGCNEKQAHIQLNPIISLIVERTVEAREELSD
jgi:hypothetical protein